MKGRRQIGPLALTRRVAAFLVALALVAFTLPFLVGDEADAAIVPTVPMGTAENYAVLGGSTVTNTGPSVLDGSLGVSPGSAIVGFPPGLVLPPGTTDAANPVAAQAQLDLTAAYINAEGRPIDGTTTADLGGLILQGGVYAGPSHSPLGLTGPLVLDGAGDPSSVFIFQTDSTLITASGSTVSLINGAQECNVFWQVGSSATLGTGSVFVGNILALTSVSVNNSVTVSGRALARNGAVTLDTDTFVAPSCDTTPTTTTEEPTTTTTEATTTTTEATTTTTEATTTTTEASTTTTEAETTTTAGPASTTTTPAELEQIATTTTTPGVEETTTTTPGAAFGTTTTTNRQGVSSGTLPRTGPSAGTTLLLAGGALVLVIGVAMTLVGRPRRL